MPALPEELAQSLRAWRSRLAPTDAGLPAGSNRRVPGLRREEVAQLADVSVDYLARLEQGRASSPSPSVLAALAQALRLSVDERSHLFTLAGHTAPGPGVIDRHVTPSLHRLLDRLADVPVLVVDAGAGIVTANSLGAALVGLSDAKRRERNTAWWEFVGGPLRLVRTPEEHARAQEATVADLHQALARHPEDRELNGLIKDLQRLSPRFAELWDLRPASRSAPARRKTFRHPEIGELTLDCDALAVQGSDLTVIVFTAPPGSRDADTLALLRDRP